MFTFLKYLLRSVQPNQFTGALIDTRSQSQKVDDVHFEEIVATANAPVWKEGTLDTARKFPVLNQYQSYTCGANALAKALGVLFYTRYNTYLGFSREDIYQRRQDKPIQGMALYDMFKIAEQGVTLEQFVKSNASTDEDFDNAKVEQWMRDVGKSFSISKGVYLSNDIDTIASVIQTTGKGVILLTYFLAGEWAKTIPYTVETLNYTDNNTLRHFVVAVDAILINGMKYLVVEDSAWFGGFNRRLVSEAWVKSRVFMAGYPMRFKFQEAIGQKPIYDGMTIISAQQCLQYEGLFPINVSFVENVGPTTRSAIKAFQIKYGLPVTQAIDTLTKNQLSKLYE